MAIDDEAVCWCNRAGAVEGDVVAVLDVEVSFMLSAPRLPNKLLLSELDDDGEDRAFDCNLDSEVRGESIAADMNSDADRESEAGRGTLLFF